MRTVLVLGGTGLTGRRLVETLLQEGLLVRCVVRNLDAARARLPAAAARAAAAVTRLARRLAVLPAAHRALWPEPARLRHAG